MRSSLGLLLTLAGAVAPLAASGCYDLPSVPAGQCGNLVVDSAEDCDGFSAFGGDTACGAPGGESACAYVCDPGADADASGGPVCPDGWGCGQDGRCRRASGSFTQAPGAPWLFPVSTLGLGDVDGDGFADLIGNDSQNMMVRYGSGTGDFAASLQFSIRRPTGPVSFGQFNSDGLLDAVVPIAEGLFVLLGDTARTLDPVAYAPFSLSGTDFSFQAVDLASAPGTEILLIDQTDSALSFFGAADGVATALPAGPPGASLILPPPVADVDGNGRQVFALMYRGDSVVQLYGSSGSSAYDPPHDLKPLARGQITLPAGWHIDEGGMFADVDGNGRPDLLLSVIDDSGGSSTRHLAVSFNIGGTLQAPVAGDVDFLHTFTGDRSLPVAAADINGDGAADYAVPVGLLLATRPGVAGNPPPSVSLVASSLPDLWHDAAFGDFNADGRMDLAAAKVDSQSGVPLDGVDLFIHSPAGPFNTFHADTERPPRFGGPSLAVGDFDGDLVPDLVLVESRPGDPDTLSVVFGSRDGGFAAAQPMGRLDTIDRVVPGLLAGSSTGFDGISDLLVLATDHGQSGVALMLGDSSRRIVSPFALDPSLVGETSLSAQVPRGVMLGDFNQDGVRDILATATPPDAAPADDGSMDRASLWLLPGQDGDGGIDTSRVTYASVAEVPGLNMRCTTWATADLSATSADVTGNIDLVGLDGSDTCEDTTKPVAPNLIVVHVHPDTNPAFEVSYDPVGTGELLYPDSVMAADLDGDGDLDPTVLFRGSTDATSNSGTTTTTGAGVAIMWNDDGSPTTTDYGTLSLPAGTLPLKLAPIDLDDDGYHDLVILTDKGVFQSLFNRSSGAFGQPSPLLYYQGGRLLGVGDVNGDGLDDIAVVYTDSVDVQLAVPAGPLGATPQSVPDQGGN